MWMSAHTWHDCKPLETDADNPNIIFALKYCTAVNKNDTWGYTFHSKPNKDTSPEYVRFAKRCEFNGKPSPTCFCPNVSVTEPATKCGYVYADEVIGPIKDYSDPKYCWQLNTMTYKPYSSSCNEHGECDVGLYYKSGSENVNGICEACLPDQTYPDKEFSPKLSNWSTCKYGEYNCPQDCANKTANNDKCGRDKSCCLGMKCSEGKCLDNTCSNRGNCIDDTDICANYGCLNGKVVYAEG